MNTPTLYLLTGVPGAGKTTWAKQHSQYEYIGSDEIRRELFGKELTLRGYRKVHKIMLQRAKECLAQGKDVVIDSAHISIRSRRKVLAAIPEGIIKIAVHIDTPVCQALVHNRRRERHVPRLGSIISGKRLVPPTVSEGFDKVIHVKIDPDIDASFQVLT